MEDLPLSHLNKYLDALDDEDIQVFDQLLRATDFTPEEGRAVHEVLVRISERLIGRETLWQMFTMGREERVLKDLIASLELNLEGEAKSDLSTKELVQALSQALNTLTRLRDQFEARHKDWMSREGMQKLIRKIFVILSEVDPVVAIKCRDSVVDELEVLTAVVPGIG